MLAVKPAESTALPSHHQRIPGFASGFSTGQDTSPTVVHDADRNKKATHNPFIAFAKGIDLLQIGNKFFIDGIYKFISN
jgi:hypothetical protein